MRASPFVSVALLFTVGFATLWSVPDQPLSAPSRKRVMGNSTPTEHTLTAGLWRADHGFVSTIHMKNALVNAPIEVTPVLFADDGAEFDLPAVQIPASGTASVEINGAIAVMPEKQRAHFLQTGSVALRYMHRGGGSVFASLQVLDVAASLNYVFPFLENAAMSMPMEQVAEGLWWKHDRNVEGQIALTNSTADPITVTVQASGSNGSKGRQKSVRLSAHQLAIVPLAELTAEVPPSERERGGVTVRYTSNSTQVVVTGWLENAAEGYSAGMAFSMRMEGLPAASQTVASVGIMYGDQMGMMGFPKGTAFIPYGVLRNTTDKPITVSATVLPTEGGVSTEKPLGQFTLKPFETRDINAADLSMKALGDYMGSINLTFTFNGNVGDVLFATGSVDQSGNYVFEVEPQYVRQSGSREADHWSVKNGNDTMLTLWNPTGSDENLAVIIYYASGSGGTDSYVYPVTLQARGAANLSLKEVIESGKPDKDGHVIPTSVTEGSLVVSGAGSRREKVTFVVSLGVFNAATATCGPDCWYCDGINSLSFAPDSIYLAIGADADKPTATPCYNDGSCDDGNNVFDSIFSWSSSDTGVATVASDGQVHAAGPGSANISGTYNAFPFYGQVCFGDCPISGQVIGSYVVYVRPSVSGSDQVWYFGGLDPSGFETAITLTSQSGATWSATAGGSKVNLDASPDGSILTVSSSGSSFSNAVGDISIVATLNGVSSLPFTITSLVPKSLSSWTITDVGRGANCLVSGTTGFLSTITYQLRDQFNDSIPNAPVTEHLSNESPIQINNWTPTPAGSNATPAGLINDLICAAGSSLTPSPTQPQSPLSSSLVDTITQSIWVGTTDPSSSPAGVHVQDDTMQRFIDHGRHSSISSPPPTWPN